LIPAVVLVAAALAVASAGLALDTDPDSPFLFPATPSPTTTTTAPPPAEGRQTTTAAPITGDQVTLSASAAVLDPIGDGAEHDRDLPLLTDGDDTTTWRTESYFAPLPLLKPGVGVVFAVDGSPATVDIIGSAGTRYTLAWAASADLDRSEYEDVAAGELREGTTRMQLTDRTGGVWLLWFTDLPEQEEGVYYTVINEVVFRS
jgi:hypothetical protein